MLCALQVAAAVSHQMTQLNTNSRYLSRGLTDYTAALAAKFAPSALQVGARLAGAGCAAVQQLPCSEAGLHRHMSTAGVAGIVC